VIVDNEETIAGSSIPRKPAIESWHELISTAARTLKSQQDIILILDSPDLLLGIEGIPADALLCLVLELRSLAKSTVILTSSDIFPFIDGSLPSALQIEQQQFLVSLIHQADYVLSSRTLDTGQASDVSGVLRVTRGGHVSTSEESQAIDKEYLYHVDAGRAAHVWQRGSDK
jgi:elongator complex protein 6